MAISFFLNVCLGDELRTGECPKQQHGFPKLNPGEMLARIHWHLPGSNLHYIVLLEDHNGKNLCEVTNPFEVVVEINRKKDEPCTLIRTRDNKKIYWADGNVICQKSGTVVTPVNSQESATISE